MAVITALTTSVQTVTATGPVTPTAGVSVSAMTGNATICVEVISLTAGATARIQIEDSVNAFTASAALAVFDVTGQEGQGGTFAQGVYNPTTDKRSIVKYQLPSSNIGVANGVVRVNVTAIAGASASLALNAWIEN